MIVENSYDELGQLYQKKVGGKTTQNRLQTVDYTYNIRGWLKGINDVNAIGNDLFSFKINYNNPTSGTGLYNGNISQTFWKTTNPTDTSLRNYDYSYDALNRLTLATDNLSHYNENLTYDKNGNIMSLFRKGNTVLNTSNFGTIDNLAYTYDAGNKLLKVDDTSGNNLGFKNGSNTSIEYVYDLNGNMIKDDNKGITAITYNHLNLPTSVTMVGGTINYTYDATGVKQRKSVPGTTTDYAGGYQYENNELQFIPQPEGYVANNSGTFSYIYQYKDHLGNVRLSYQDSNNNGSIDSATEIVEENNYYPFGLKQERPYNVVSSLGNSAGNKYKYNGKELQDELNLNMYDYGARNYDPALGRWMNIDPLAELSRRYSPYVYCYNNPVRFIDPDGMYSTEEWKKDNGVKDSDLETVYQADNSDSPPPDDITVGANGRITNVVKNDKPNRFFDKKGNQLKANDSSVDNQFLEFEWNVGDQLFVPISISTFYKFIAKAGIMPYAGVDLVKRYIFTAYQSHTAADFGYNQLMKAYNESYAGTEYGGNIGNGTFYRFQGTNTLYNLGDAGNFLWGAWMSFNNFSSTEVKAGSQLNSIFTLNGFDTASDQRAIQNGFNYLKK